MRYIPTPSSLSPINIHAVNILIPSLLIKDRINLYQNTLGWPTKFALTQAIPALHLVTFSGNSTIKKIQEYYSDMAPSIKGRLVQERLYLQSTDIINLYNDPNSPSLGDDVTPRRLITDNTGMYAMVVKRSMVSIADTSSDSAESIFSANEIYSI